MHLFRERSIFRGNAIFNGKVTLPADGSLLGSTGLLVAKEHYVDVVIPTASVLTLNSVPVSLVPAPGAGKVNIFARAVIYMPYNSAAYASVHDASVKYTDGSGVAVGVLTGSGFFDATSSQLRLVNALAASGGLVPVANAPLVLAVATGDMTTGNSPLHARIFYFVAPVA